MTLSLQFIGCGDAFGSGGRFNTCFHLTGDETNLLIEIAAGQSIDLGFQQVSAYQAQHGPPDGSFLALRIEAEGKSLAYTGDTEWTPDLIPAARDVDLFIAESYFREKTIATHLSLHTIEEHLDALRPKRLVLTHMSDDMLNHPDRAKFETAEDGKLIVIG